MRYPLLINKIYIHILKIINTKKYTVLQSRQIFLIINKYCEILQIDYKEKTLKHLVNPEETSVLDPQKTVEIKIRLLLIHMH